MIMPSEENLLHEPAFLQASASKLRLLSLSSKLFGQHGQECMNVNAPQIQ